MQNSQVLSFLFIALALSPYIDRFLTRNTAIKAQVSHHECVVKHREGCTAGVEDRF
jgi:hypothetical protein